jgi:CheY-like chemotaxis protein
VTEQVVARRTAEDLAVQLERALVGEYAARQAAEAANRAKDSFLATVSHEIRTPLTAMLGWTRMLIDGKVSAAKREHALAVIERNAVAQTHLVDDLLDVSRIIAGNMRVQFAEVALVPLIEAAIDTVRPALDAKGLELRASLGAVTFPVLGDAIRLQQVIWNLLVNAVKFTPRGGLIRVTLTSDDSRVEVRVDDNGRGISADFLPKIFDRFEQAATGSHQSQSGLGLGLAISRHLVELHRGHLEAHSEGEGRGASFVLSLPVAAVREAPPLQSSALCSEPRPGGAGDLEGLRVLVVDDEESARDRISSLLSGHGAVAIAVQNVAEALDALVQYRPDVVVSDIGLPGEDGYSFIRRARSLSPASGSETPAAALTSHASEEDRARALVAGFQAHLSKSVSPAQIVATVAELARLARKLR